MAVITQCQRLGQVVRQGREAAEMTRPVRVGQRVEPDFRGGAIVAEAQDRLRKFGRLDLVVELPAQLQDRALGTVEAGSHDAYCPRTRPLARRMTMSGRTDLLVAELTAYGLTFPGAHGKA